MIKQLKSKVYWFCDTCRSRLDSCERVDKIELSFKKQIDGLHSILKELVAYNFLASQKIDKVVEYNSRLCSILDVRSGVSFNTHTHSALDLNDEEATGPNSNHGDKSQSSVGDLDFKGFHVENEDPNLGPKETNCILDDDLINNKILITKSSGRVKGLRESEKTLSRPKQDCTSVKMTMTSSFLTNGEVKALNEDEASERPRPSNSSALKLAKPSGNGSVVPGESEFEVFRNRKERTRD